LAKCLHWWQAEEYIQCCGAIAVGMTVFSKGNKTILQISKPVQSTKAFKFDNQHHNTRTQHARSALNDSLSITALNSE
jgi:hypothetical protein